MPDRAGVLTAWLMSAVLGVAGAAFAADWVPPKDDLITDKQVTSYLAAMKDVVGAWKAAAKSAQGASPIVAGGVIANMDGRMKAAIAKNGLAEAEFKWVGGKVWEAKAALVLDEALSKARGEMDDRLKKSADDQAVLARRIAECEKALKTGRRVMTADEKSDAIKAAQSDQQAADDDAKSHRDAAKEAADAAAKSEGDAKAALALAAKPPADVPVDGREDYVAGKKKEAEDATAAAKESRDKEVEEQKAVAEAMAKARAAAARAKDPELPVTDDEKAEAKSKAQDMLTSAQSDLKTAQESDAQLRQVAAQMQQQLAANQSPSAEKNAAIFKPHAKEFDDTMAALK